MWNINLRSMENAADLFFCQAPGQNQQKRFSVTMCHVRAKYAHFWSQKQLYNHEYPLVS